MFIKNGIVFSDKLSKFDDILVHGMSTRFYDNLSFLNGRFASIKTRGNRKRFLAHLNIELSSIVNVFLTHGTNIYDVTLTDLGKGAYYRKTLIPNTDGLITKEKGVYLMVTIADCLPIFFFEPNKKVVSIIHAGWKGTVERISEKMVMKMARHYECKSENIIVFIGPSIGPCHYEVKDDITSQFDKKFLTKKGDGIYLDLWQANVQQLLESGVKESNIELARECTVCHLDRYSSYRAEGENKYIAMAAVIGMK